MGNTVTGRKRVYLEMMRIIACMMVIFNHLPGFKQFLLIGPGKRQILCMWLSIIVKTSVPVFYMISGALLLAKEEDWGTVFRKRFLRVVYLIMIFTFLMMLVLRHRYGTDFDFSFSTYFHGITANNIEGTDPYWYLYSYLGILFVLPMLQRLAKGIKKAEFYAILALRVLCSIVLPSINPILEKMQLKGWDISVNFSVPFAFETILLFPIAGYYLEHCVDVTKFKARHVCGLIFTALAGLLITSWYIYQEYFAIGQFTEGRVSMCDYLIAIPAFLLVKYIFVVGAPRLSEGKIGKTICLLGSLTLGIYMIDPCMKKLFYLKYEALVDQKLHVLVISLIWVIMSFALSGFITFVLKKIPGIRKLF